jgi:hypothetical protein
MTSKTGWRYSVVRNQPAIKKWSFPNGRYQVRTSDWSGQAADPHEYNPDRPLMAGSTLSASRSNAAVAHVVALNGCLLDYLRFTYPAKS